MALWTKDTPSMTSAKYISQSLFSSNSNPGYSGFALWRDRALRSPEIAIAHLSQGLRSSYHGGGEVHLNFCLFNMPGNHDARLILKFGERLVLLFAPSTPLRLCGSHKELVRCHQISYHMTLSAGRQLHLSKLSASEKSWSSKCVYSFSADVVCLCKQIYIF